MIKSMTGFGRGEILKEDLKITVEMKAVNHRYFDVNIRMPRNLNVFEAQVRNILKRYIERGKIDVFISLEDYAQSTVSLRYNAALAQQYYDSHQMIAQQFGMENDLRPSNLGRCPEVIVLEEHGPDESRLWETLKEALETACRGFVEARKTEGAHLKEDILLKLSGMEKNVLEVEKRYPQIVEDYAKRIREKVTELIGDSQIDESRLAAELVIFSDKLCTDEETVRLKSHIAAMRKELEGGGAVGRKLDFIAQEMNREANTILSKANDLATSQTAIELKTDIEKVREQIQNIE